VKSIVFLVAAFLTSGCNRQPSSQPVCLEVFLATRRKDIILNGFPESLLPSGVKKLTPEMLPPTAITAVQPTVPPDLRVVAIDDEIIDAELVVHADGSSSDLRITQTRHPELNAYILRALRKWTFSPATLKGEPVTVNLPIWVFVNPCPNERDPSSHRRSDK
jgi:hypothetical protein